GVPAATTTTVVATEPTNPSTTLPPTEFPEPIEGWQRAYIDHQGVFGGAVVGDAIATEETIVVVGCSPWEVRSGIWYSEVADGYETWHRAEGPSDITCLDQIVSTPWGLFSYQTDVIRSVDDGRTWTQVGVTEFGYVQHLAYVDGRLTAITSMGSLNETTVATLYTTTDGESWETVSDERSSLFDSAEVADIVAGGPVLVAVGASPGGQFVPTAAVWVSDDGLDWRLVTPQGVGFADSWMSAIATHGDLFVAVGADFDSSLMAAWTSSDGMTWTRSPAPAADIVPEFGYMNATALSSVDGVLYAAGVDFDAGRESSGGLVEIPAGWTSPDGVDWTRADRSEVAGRVPFSVVGNVGFWPPIGWSSDGPEAVVRVLSQAG
ncbi:hypothetical protein HQ535_00360, partial [bacterium]|nr:hypothetical protein [bacterium]